MLFDISLLLSIACACTALPVHSDLVKRNDTLDILKQALSRLSTSTDPDSRVSILSHGPSSTGLSNSASNTLASLKGYYQLDFKIANGNKSYEVDLSKISALTSGKLSSLGNDDDGDSGKDPLANKRGLTELVTVKNQQTFYSVDLKIGSSKQSVAVLLDTGSSDLWVPTKQLSSNLGFFTPAKSSSYHKLNSQFGIRYGDGTYAKGTWAKDDVSLGTMDVNLQFGVADNVTATQGVLGLGFPGNEVANPKYDNLPQLLKQKGYIKKAAYSLFLNSDDASSGSILFGAVDTKKYEGSLNKIPLIDINDSGIKVNSTVAFFVNLTSVDAKAGQLSEGHSYPALLDSGTTLLYAPEDLYKKIGKSYGWHLPGIGYIEKCDKYDGQNITFSFPNLVKIQVPVSKLMYPLLKKSGEQYKSLFRRKPLCMVGIQKSSLNFVILGDNVLRSAYVHYNLDDRMVGMAQVKYSKESNIVTV